MRNTMKRSSRMVSKLIAVAVIGGAVYGQDQKPVIDNERVTVWDVTWTKGAINPAGSDRDVVVMELTGSHARTARFIAKGSERKPGGNGARSLIIELKEHPVAPIE